MPHDELTESIESVPKRGTGGTPLFSGKLSAETTLSDVLRQVVSSSETHGMLRILSKGCSGYIGFYMGTIITGAHATTTGEQGLEAVRTLLGARSGLYGFVALPERPKELQQNLYISLEVMLEDGRSLVEAFESIANLKRSQEAQKPAPPLQPTAPSQPPAAEESLIDGDLMIFAAWGEDIAPVAAPKTTRSLSDLVNTKTKMSKINLNVQPQTTAHSSEPDFWVTDARDAGPSQGQNFAEDPIQDAEAVAASWAAQKPVEEPPPNPESWGGWAPTAPIIEPLPADAPAPKKAPAFDTRELSAIPTPRVARDPGTITGRHAAVYPNDPQRTTGKHGVVGALDTSYIKQATTGQLPRAVPTAQHVTVKRKSPQVVILENLFVCSMVIGVVAAGIFFTKEAQKIGRLNDTYVVGQGLIKKHEYQAALNAFAKLEGTEFNRMALLMGKATAHAGMSEWSAAVNEYNQVLEMSPNIFPARYGRALCYLKSAAYEKAIEDATRCIQERPKQGALYLLRAVAYAHVADFDKAMADCETATKCSATAAEASVHATLAFIFFQKKDYEDAVAEYTAAIEKDPKNGQFYAGRAEAYEKMGNKIAAAADAGQAIFYDPHDIAMLILRAECALKAGDRNKALEDLNKAATIAPCPEVLRARAKLYMSEHNYKAAYSDLEQLVAVSPGDTDARRQMQYADQQIRAGISTEASEPQPR